MQNPDNIRQVVCFGSGGVAWSLLPALCKAGYSVSRAVSPNIENARELASQINALALDAPDHCCYTADLAILAVPDAVVETLLPFFKNSQTLVVHTAGSLPLQIFENSGIANYGVIYPLQTFTRRRCINMADVPVFVEGNTAKNVGRLFSVASHISNSVKLFSSQERLQLHLAAVFACNFTNHCLSIAASILQKSDMPQSVMHPLINETIKKALAVKSPKTVQTGPAVRGDQIIMEKHVNMLKDSPLCQKLYEVMSESIQQFDEVKF